MRLEKDFFARDALTVAPELVGKTLVRVMPDGEIRKLVISETEAYMGEKDTACHAHRGRTKRNAPLYMAGGIFYIYLCYGIHWLLNTVTGAEGEPQGVLIRACRGSEGPGKLTKQLTITGELNCADIASCPFLWIEDDGIKVDITTAPRVGIAYASPEDRARPWRFMEGK